MGFKTQEQEAKKERGSNTGKPKARGTGAEGRAFLRAWNAGTLKRTVHILSPRGGLPIGGRA